MKRKKPAQKVQPQKNVADAVAERPQPILQGNAFVSFIREASSLGNEVEARRAFDKEVGEYLSQKGLVDDFEGWRRARSTPPAAS